MRIKKFVIYITVLSIFLTIEGFGQENAYKQKRFEMVKSQIHSRGITDERILNAFRTVPRHRFVLPGYEHLAYEDSPLPIDEGQTISQPYIVAYMTEILDLKDTDKVLEVGTGSGYQAAILAQLCDSVFTIEIFELLAVKAQAMFNELNYHNIYCKVGDGFHGWKEKAPFDAIIVSCAPGAIPENLKEQLAEGGRMIIPVGENAVQYLVFLQKQNGKIKKKRMLPVRFVPMINDKREKY